MPSELVHVAFAGYLAAGLLGPAFCRRSVVVVLGAALLPDLDAVVSIWWPGVHRALFHSVVSVTVFGVLLAGDLRRDQSLFRRQFGRYGRRVAIVAVGGMLIGGIAPDLVTNGVNLFYPLVDRFYALDGHLLVSTTRGVVQSFIEFHRGGGQTVVGTTSSTFYPTGVDPTRGSDPRTVERIFPVVNSGMQLLVVLTSSLALWGRFREQSTGTGIDEL